MTNSESDRAATERLNVVLIPDSVEALSNVQSRTGYKKVDIVNRALALYDFFDEEIRAGNQIILRDQDGQEQRVKILL